MYSPLCNYLKIQQMLQPTSKEDGLFLSTLSALLIVRKIWTGETLILEAKMIKI